LDEPFNGSEPECRRPDTVDLNALTGIVAEISDPEFRARVADVIWTTRPKGNFQVAKLAVAAFMDSAARLKDKDSWTHYVERLDRAAQIAAKKGFETERAAVVHAVESGIAEYEGEPSSGLLCSRLMAILLLLEEGDNTRYAKLSEELALHYQHQNDWHFSESYWEQASCWHRSGGRHADVQRCQLAAAECNISNAEAGIEKQGALFAAHWLSRGLIALREARADKARIVEIHQRLLEVQRLSLNELKPIGVDEDAMPGMAENREQHQAAVAAHIQGNDIQTASPTHRLINKPTNHQQLKEQYAKQSREFSRLERYFEARRWINRKVSEIQAPEIGSDPEAQAQSLPPNLCNQARMIYWPIQVVWRIEPAVSR
jgi:hypothetical protein